MTSKHSIAAHSGKARRSEILARFESGSIDVFCAIKELDLASGLDAKARKDSGVVYTPPALALRMCSMADPGLDERILEPSCGRGVFVFALAEHHMARGIDAQECADALGERLRACELDAEAESDLQALWKAYWRRLGIRPPRLRSKSEDSLFAGFSAEHFDLAIGNPPYVRFQNLDEGLRARLQSTYASCARGNVDLYFAFAEQCMSQAERSCLVMPSGWMDSASGASLRAAMLPRLSRLVDFGDSLVFAPARAYACIALFHKDPVVGPILTKRDAGADDGSPWEPVERSDPRLASGPWRLRAPKAATGGPGTAAKTLGDIAQVHSGIATLSDASYCFHATPGPDGMLRFHDETSGRDLAIVESLCPKRAKLTKCRSEADLASLGERILLPYEGGSLIPEKVLRAKHPGALAFLRARKAALARRDKGKQAGYEGWHAYGRKQGLAELPKGRLVALPLMSNNGMKPFEFDTAATGRFLFTSGFVLSPKPGSSSAEIVQALTHPDSWAWMLSHGKAWAGQEGDAFRSYGAGLLRQMPLPRTGSAP